jgi:hypothetical protein
MVDFKKLRILHLLSQRPDSTGSGIYVQAMMREATACGYDNYLVAGIQSDGCDVTEYIAQKNAMYVTFHNADVSYQIPGMSDVMPYESTRFCDLSEEDLCEYETAFSEILRHAVSRFKPDIIHSHHLWIVSSVAIKSIGRWQRGRKRALPWTCKGTGGKGSGLRRTFSKGFGQNHEALSYFGTTFFL